MKMFFEIGYTLSLIAMGLSFGRAIGLIAIEGKAGLSLLFLFIALLNLACSRWYWKKSKGIK